MIYTTLTNMALKICFKSHKDQTDKNGIPYVFHPYEVASQLKTENEICVALLHDVVEDSDYTFEDLEETGFNQEIIGALKLLTHSKEVPYFDYIAEIKNNPIAKAVKMADLKHNSTISRLNNISEKDLKRIEKYKTALAMLMD